MNFKRINILQKLIILASALIVFSCTRADFGFMEPGQMTPGSHLDRGDGSKFKNVFLLYSAGYNDLSKEFDYDVQDILDNYIPNSRREAILIFSHRTKSAYNYIDKTSPTLTRVYIGTDGETVCDTLLVMDPETPSVSSETVREVLTYVKENFPSERYGMMFSSHGTGWLPAGFKFTKSTSWKASVHDAESPLYMHGERPEGLPAVRSAGYQAAKNSSPLEIDIKDFAEAIPMHLDYLIFDACLMGCVEVAYEFREKCNHLIVSPAEILVEGMDYETAISYLIRDSGPDLVGFSRNYYEFYNDPSRSSAYRSGTITLVDCNQLEQLAQTCKGLFNTYRTNINNLESRKMYVQQYYTASAHKCFYDLEDIIANCSASTEDLALLNEALDKCIPYCASTDYILGYIKVRNYSGLSMYLPLSSEKTANQYYRTLEWNKATGLLQ